MIELQKRVRNPGAIMHPAIHRELKTCQANLKVVEAKYMTFQFHFFQILIPLCMVALLKFSSVVCYSTFLFSTFHMFQIHFRKNVPVFMVSYLEKILYIYIYKIIHLLTYLLTDLNCNLPHYIVEYYSIKY